MPRVSTYLNFPGNAEEAFIFYKGVFKTEFCSDIKRFKDAPPQEGCPTMPPEASELILHIELPILGGHILMATDAPASMGFNCHGGTNTYINLETDAREETERLFKELSAGGKIEMPLQDMFWGAYFASFTDKYGINWMLNCASK